MISNSRRRLNQLSVTVLMSVMLVACGGGSDTNVSSDVGSDSNSGSNTQVFASPVLATGALVELPAECKYQVMIVTAHHDDDLWFLSPDIKRHLDAGACFSNVVTTNGKPESQTFKYSLNRIYGYATAWSYFLNEPKVGVADWRTSRRTINGYIPLVYSHISGKAETTFLGIDDAMVNGLAGLKNETVTSIAVMEMDFNSFQAKAYPDLAYDSDGVKLAKRAKDSVETYRRSAAVATLAELIKAVDPRFVYTQDSSIETDYLSYQWAGGEGHDHPSHVATARLVDDAVASLPSLRTTLIHFTDYPIQGRPENISLAEKKRQLQGMYWYSLFDPLDGFTACKMSTYLINKSPTCKLSSNKVEFSWLGKFYFAHDWKMSPNAVVMNSNSSGGKVNDVVATYVGNRSPNLYQNVNGWYFDMSFNVKNLTSGQSYTLRGNYIGTPSIALGGDGRVSAWARQSDGLVRYLPSKMAGGWWPEVTWKGVMMVDPVAIKNRDGRLGVLSIDQDGALVYRAEIAIGQNWNEDWIPTGVDNLSASPLTVAVDNSGRIVVTGVNVQGEVVLARQVSPGWRSFDRVVLPFAPSTEASLVVEGANLHVSARSAADGEIKVISTTTSAAGGATFSWSTPEGLVPSALALTSHQLQSVGSTLRAFGRCGVDKAPCVMARGEASKSSLDSNWKGAAKAIPSDSLNRYIGRDSGGNIAMVRR